MTDDTTSSSTPNDDSNNTTNDASSSHSEYIRNVRRKLTEYYIANEILSTFLSIPSNYTTTTTRAMNASNNNDKNENTVVLTEYERLVLNKYKYWNWNLGLTMMLGTFGVLCFVSHRRSLKQQQQETAKNMISSVLTSAPTKKRISYASLDQLPTATKRSTAAATTRTTKPISPRTIPKTTAPIQHQSQQSSLSSFVSSLLSTSPSVLQETISFVNMVAIAGMSMSVGFWVASKYSKKEKYFYNISQLPVFPQQPQHDDTSASSLFSSLFSSSSTIPVKTATKSDLCDLSCPRVLSLYKFYHTMNFKDTNMNVDTTGGATTTMTVTTNTRGDDAIAGVIRDSVEVRPIDVQNMIQEVSIPLLSSSDDDDSSIHNNNIINIKNPPETFELEYMLRLVYNCQQYAKVNNSNINISKNDSHQK